MTLEKFLETHPNNLISTEEYLLHCNRTYTPKYWDTNQCSYKLQNILDNVHCVMGIVDEFDEYLDVLSKGCDSNKMVDEMGDIFWYIANYCNFNNIEFIGSNDMQLEYNGEFTKLLGIHKKELAYFKDPDINECTTLIQRGIKYLMLQLEQNSISLNHVLFMNLKKLYIRYPDKFESELAINKDIDNEFLKTFY